MDCSSGNETFFTRSPSFLESKPCSLREKPSFNACPRITVLNALLPVKYKTANGYSSGVVYKKSTRRAPNPGNCAITRHFDLPRDNTSIMIFS